MLTNSSHIEAQTQSNRIGLTTFESSPIPTAASLGTDRADCASERAQAESEQECARHGRGQLVAKHEAQLVGSAGSARSFKGVSSIAAALLLASVSGLGLSACGGGGGSSAATAGNALEVQGGLPGEFFFDSNNDEVFDVGTERSFFLETVNESGQSNNLRLTQVVWGRLVNIYDFDAAATSGDGRTLQYRDFLIAESVVGDETNYLLERNAITEQTDLTILRKRGTPEFEDLFLDATSNLAFVNPTSLSPTELPPFPLVPRNATLMLRFSDLLDPATINEQNIRLKVGNPPIQPFGIRVIADNNHGAVVGGTFYPSRVLIDTTISELEGQQSSLPINTVGLPASVSNQLVNIAIQIPTRTNSVESQLTRLENLSKHGLSFTNNGPSLVSPTMDVVRAFRSGRSDDADTNTDPNNGYLLDTDRPQILGAQGITITSILAQPGDGNYLVDFRFESPVCQQTPRVDHVIEVPGAFAVVTELAAPPQNGVAAGIRVRVLGNPQEVDAYAAITAEFEASSQGQYLSTYEPGPGVVDSCFIQINPPPGSAPAAGIDDLPVMTVRFSEPMDPVSIQAHDNFRLNRVAGEGDLPLPSNIVVGSVNASSDLRQFSYQPVQRLSHDPGNGDSTDERYFLNLIGGTTGVTDLAGNGLKNPLGDDIAVTVSESLPAVSSGGFVLRFNRADEDRNGTPDMPQPEIRGGGQVFFDFVRGIVRPRSASRQSVVIDRVSNPLYTIMTSTGAPIITPLAPLGSRMQTVYRYADAGFSVLDETTANVDIEGINWAPFGGDVSADFFDLFEMTLSHSRRIPDEFPIPITAGGGGYAQFENSGLLKNFKVNYFPADVSTTVHPRNRGYLVDSSLAFTSATGTLMMPYPLNRTVDPADFNYFTWRDTTLLGGAGPQSFGVDLKALATVGLVCQTSKPSVYDPGSVRSLGLPLLMEFKCFPDDGAVGLNGFDTSFALATQRFPAFRVFSTGGFNKSGAPLSKDPDAENIASGSLNANPMAVNKNGNPIPIGGALPGDDNTVYLGQLDLVLRVSRAHTIWFDSGLANPDYADPVLEPSPDNLPNGTNIVLAFRGANSVTGDDFQNANQYDAYGDPLSTRVIDIMDTCDDPLDDEVEDIVADITVVPFAEPEDIEDTWVSSIHDVDGAKFIQARITFVSNVAVVPGIEPELSTLAIAFQQ